MKYNGHYSSGNSGKKGKKKSSIVWIVLGTILGLILVVGVAAVLYVHFMLGLVKHPVEESRDPNQALIDQLIGNLDEDETEPAVEPISEPTEETTVETTPPDYSKTGKIINILIIGQDSREGEEAKLSDTMMLLTINRETNTMTMTSFLRDMYIKLPNMWGHKCGKNRINTAYALGCAWKGELGGMQMLDQLILEQFGTTVDYNVEIDFVAFEKIIDALGGIEIEMDEDETNYMNNYDCFGGRFQVGENHMEGLAALYYARMRKATASDSDMNRTARQRKVLSIVVDKCRTMSVTQLHNLLTQLLPEVLTDMPNDVILTYAAELLPSIASLKLESMQIPADGTYHGEVIEIYDQASGVLVPDVEANKELLMAVAEADTLENP